MDLLADYGEEDEGETTIQPKNNKLITKVNLTPNVLIKESSRGAIQPYIGEITHNPTYEELHAPLLGPENPYTKNMGGNLALGNVQNFNMNVSVFNSEFEKSSGGKNKKKLKRKKGFNDPKKDNYLGPWASFEMDTTDQSENFAEEFYEDEQEEEEEKEETKEVKKKKSKEEQEDEGHSEEEGEGTKPKGEFVEPPSKSNFYLDSQYDYQGRTFISPPSYLKINEEAPQNFLPKKLIHTFDAHTKPITAIELFPQYGHLILSASMDETIKIFDVMDHKKLIRDFIGHSQPVKSIAFQQDGKAFASGSFDKICRIWDVESGNAIKSFEVQKPVHCIKFHPEKNHEIFLGVGKRVEQYDLRSGDLIQSYGGHQGPITSISFFDDNKKFISSSDDKTIRIWENQVPMVLRKIRNYNMDQIKSVAVHPSGEYFVAQSINNQIFTFDTTEKYKLNGKKNFSGHIVPVSGSRVVFSNDGRFLMSGDSEGKVWIWDWKTAKKLKTMNAHPGGVCNDCQWHPIESSKCFSAGWDGKICLFD